MAEKDLFTFIFKNNFPMCKDNINKQTCGSRCACDSAAVSHPTPADTTATALTVNEEPPSTCCGQCSCDAQ